MNDERKIAAVKEKIRVEALIIAREKEEEIHKNRMREGGCQASVTMVDAATFTEFLCPPSMSLRYTANALALNDKRKKVRKYHIRTHTNIRSYEHTKNRR